MGIRSVARHSFAFLMGLVCAFLFFMTSVPLRPQWMSINLFLTALAAVLFLVCRLAGPLSLGLLITYCAPIGLIVLAFLSGEGLIGPKLEPLFAVLTGALTSFVVVRPFEWLRNRPTARGPGHET